MTFSHRGEAELRTTCDTNMNGYENQNEKKFDKSFLSIKIATKAQNTRNKNACTIRSSTARFRNAIQKPTFQKIVLSAELSRQQ